MKNIPYVDDNTSEPLENGNSDLAYEKELLGRCVCKWRKEVARLSELIDLVTAEHGAYMTYGNQPINNHPQVIRGSDMSEYGLCTICKIHHLFSEPCPAIRSSDKGFI